MQSARFAAAIASSMTADPGLAPTRHRARQGPIERFDKQIADEAGRPSRPYKAVDILASLERRGAITADQRQAGEDFRAKFRIAALDSLKAADMGRVIISGSRARWVSGREEAARDWLWESLRRAGGLASHGGSCLWHVVGLEESLRQWAASRQGINPHNAAGILIAALGMIEGRS